MAGGQEGTSSMSIYGSVLRTEKTAWSKPVLLSQDPSRSEQNPLLFVTTDGRIHLVHTAQESRPPNDLSWQREGTTFSKQWTATLRHQATTSWNHRWGAATDLIAMPAFCRHAPAPGIEGNWLLPIYRSLEEGGAFGHDHSFVLPLGPDGSAAGIPVAVPDSVGRVHGSIVRSADGQRLVQFFRSRLADCVYRSIGSLDGKHWTPPEPVGLPNNNSSIHAVRLSSGLLAMAFNRFSAETGETLAWGQAIWPRTRWPLTIAISDDDGAHWPWVRDVDPGLGFCGEANWHLNGQLAYPSMVEGLPGELHLAYSWGSQVAIRYLCLRVQDITG